MQNLPASNFLRCVLAADAATCAATGLLLALGADWLEQTMRLPAHLSLYAGLSLLPFAAFLIYLARQKNLSPTLIWVVIALNALWTADSILIVLGGWIEPNALGSAFVIFQACGVAMFAGLEYFGLRKLTRALVV